MPIVFKLLAHKILLAWSRVLPSAGIKTDNRNAIIEITTSNSTRVNAFIFLLIVVSPFLSSRRNCFEVTAVGECKVNEIDHTVAVEVKAIAPIRLSAT